MAHKMAKENGTRILLVSMVKQNGTQNGKTKWHTNFTFYPKIIAAELEAAGLGQ